MNIEYWCLKPSAILSFLVHISGTSYGAMSSGEQLGITLPRMEKRKGNKDSVSIIFKLSWCFHGCLCDNFSIYS